MKVTDEARAVLNEVFKANSADGLLVEVHETCCGKSPVFQIAVFDENDHPVDFDGVKFVVPEEAQEMIEDMIIDFANGELVVMSATPGGCSGCGGGCDSHEHHHHDADCGCQHE